MKPNKFLFFTGMFFTLASGLLSAEVKNAASQPLIDTLGLSYDYEELIDEKWVLLRRNGVSWDFKNEKVGYKNIIWNYPHRTFNEVSGGLVRGKHVVLIKNIDLPKGKGILDLDGVDDLQKNQVSAFVSNQPYVGGIDLYVSSFYMIEGEFLLESFPVVRNRGDELSLEVGSKKYAIKFGENGFPEGVSLFFKLKTSDDFVETHSTSIRKMKMINGKPVPVEIDGWKRDIVFENGGMKMSDKKTKFRMKVVEDSIRVDETFSDHVFMIKIPVGTMVADRMRGMMYKANGLDDTTNSEALGDALEEVLKRAIENKIIEQ